MKRALEFVKSHDKMNCLDLFDLNNLNFAKSQELIDSLNEIKTTISLRNFNQLKFKRQDFVDSLSYAVCILETMQTGARAESMHVYFDED